MACPFIRLSESGIFVTGIRLLIAGACKERCGQTKSDLETEARIRPLEAILEGSGRCQGSDQGWRVPARNRGPWAATWAMGAQQVQS